MTGGRAFYSVAKSGFFPEILSKLVSISIFDHKITGYEN